jgi:hypothetical protein
VVAVENHEAISQILKEAAADSQIALANIVQGRRDGAIELLERQRSLTLTALGGLTDATTEVTSEVERAYALGTERGDVCAVVVRADIDAAKRLIKRWRPWPFDRRAQGVLKKMPLFAKITLLERLPQDLVDEITRLNCEPRRWCANRRYLKEKNGRPAVVTVDELTPTFFLKQLRNIACKLNTSAILSPLNYLPLKDTHGKIPSYESQLLDLSCSPEACDEVGDLDCMPADSPDDSCDAPVDTDSLELIKSQPGIRALLEIAERVATPREIELIDEIRLQVSEGRVKPNGRPNLAEAARVLQMNPTTARVHFRNLRKKALRAASKAN